ncbi:MAG: hypothetical protein UV54_C0012G0008 [Candidatus Beckwithbacteria bacterium GW2011_GWA2_43_10]|uniref:Uncharacterized protein n=1 Tax=Candidatus Beckwithbacteria bacterium GW2011_GWA2_43_10 TaxID=1618369 RepID=A0A0G1C3V4_9BACT|nr:MAG: hypothetical protein UV54_C0012G0008 [Candidatus Beckwithbacteria bacterium GW2011_GWA2_43_10]
MTIYRGREGEFARPDGFAELTLPNQLGLVVYEDELWEETRGTLGRVNILAHYFNVGAEVLVGLGERDVLTYLDNLPGK